MYLDCEWFHMVAGVPKHLSLHFKKMSVGRVLLWNLSTKIPDQNS
jgi:hypothetical protein